MQSLRLRTRSKQGTWVFYHDGGGEPLEFDSLTSARWEARKQLVADEAVATVLVYGKQDVERWGATE